MKEDPSETLIKWLTRMSSTGASDIYLFAGKKPIIRGSTIEPLSEHILSRNDLNEFLRVLLSREQSEYYSRHNECDLSLNIGKGGRFRVNCSRALDMPGIVFRNIPLEIPTLEQLNQPEFLGKICMKKRGLVLVTGATGSGKSTTMAAMLDYRNQREPGHILTVEDPIEFIHTDKKCFVRQREVEKDTDSFKIALKEALRQHPDVILVGEVRDRNTMENALNISETGHLALATLHANTAAQTLSRVLTFYQPMEARQILDKLSINLMAVISQRLLPTLDGKMTCVQEIMLCKHEIPDLIAKGDIKGINKAIKKYEPEGMILFDDSLARLVKQNIISPHTALIQATDEDYLKKQLANSTSVPVSKTLSRI